MITFKITWKHVFFDLPLTEEEYKHFKKLIDDSLEHKQGVEFIANGGKKKTIIPYNKLKKGIITFDNIPTKS